MPSGLTSRRTSHDGSVSSSGGGGGGGGSRRGTEEAAPRPVIHPMPPKPLSLLRQLTGYIRVGLLTLSVLSHLKSRFQMSQRTDEEETACVNGQHVQIENEHCDPMLLYVVCQLTK